MCIGGGSHVPSPLPPPVPQAPPDQTAAALSPLVLGSRLKELQDPTRQLQGQNALKISLGSLPASTGLQLAGG